MVLTKIKELPDNPRPAGNEKIGEDEYRVRTGRWRIIYLVNDKARRVMISRVRIKNERTYK